MNVVCFIATSAKKKMKQRKDLEKYVYVYDSKWRGVEILNKVARAGFTGSKDLKEEKA